MPQFRIRSRRSEEPVKSPENRTSTWGCWPEWCQKSNLRNPEKIMGVNYNTLDFFSDSEGPDRKVGKSKNLRFSKKNENSRFWKNHWCFIVEFIDQISQFSKNDDFFEKPSFLVTLKSRGNGVFHIFGGPDSDIRFWGRLGATKRPESARRGLGSFSANPKSRDARIHDFGAFELQKSPNRKMTIFGPKCH